MAPSRASSAASRTGSPRRCSTSSTAAASPAAANWVWSYHNYGDVEQGTSRVTALRARLAGRWRGLERDGGPAMAATEGGCRLSAVGDGLSYDERLRRQAERLARAVDRHRNACDLGAGLTLLTQYTAMADPGYDCGLREPDGAGRPAFGAWRSALA